MKTTRVLQIVLLILLIVSFAQVSWWIFDEGNYTRKVKTRVRDLYAAEVKAAQVLLGAGTSPDAVRELFPHLSVADDASHASISFEAISALDFERVRRLNRYGWEGVFFLAVLAAGMVILFRALHADATLRRRQQNFMAAVSHEFKSPLASIKLGAETLALRDPKPEARERILTRMTMDVHRLEGMVTNILDTARIEEGRATLVTERIELQQAVKQIVDAMRDPAEAVGVTLTSEVPVDLAVAADSAALLTVIRNLTDNAVKATEANGGGTVLLHAEQRDRNVCLEVRDDGVGFAPEEARRLFGKFYRPGDELRRRSRGSGLGLYIVRRLMDLAGGKVVAHSEGPGTGAVFAVSWPAPKEIAS